MSNGGADLRQSLTPPAGLPDGRRHHPRLALVPKGDHMSRPIQMHRALCATALWAGMAATAPVAAETRPATARALLAVSAVVLSRCDVALLRAGSAPHVDCGRDKDSYQVAPSAPGLERTTEVVAIAAATRIVEVKF